MGARKPNAAWSDAPDRGEESAGEPVQGHAGEFCRAEPGHVTEFAVSNRGDTADDFSLSARSSPFPARRREPW